MCLVGAGIAGSLAAVWVLRAFPNSGDEYNYLFEAKTFLAGRLWNPEPPLSEVFSFYHASFQDGKWFTQYPPGWPVLLALTMGLHLPAWLACPLAGGLVLFALFKLGQRREGPLGGALAVGLVVFSPFFLFNAGSYFNHVPAAAAGLLFCWGGAAFFDRPRLSNAWLAGTALGALGLIRPLDALLLACPFCVEASSRARRPHYRKMPALIIGGLPFVAALLIYYEAINGSIMPDGGQASPVRFGLFGVDEAGNTVTPLDNLRLAVTRIVMLADWTSPLLVLGYTAALAWLGARHRLSFSDFIFPLFVVAYLFVPFTGGNQYGPRYYFEAWPFLILTVVSALTPLIRDAARPRIRLIAGSLVAAHGIICIGNAVIIGLFLRTLVDQRMDLYDQVRAGDLHNIVIVVQSATSNIAPMGPRDLTRNGIALDGEVIYALDIPDRLSELRQMFPQRRFYIYEREPVASKGTLRPLW